ncbi:helix-turn-helix transcriptional regulator [Streptomyces sp. NA04227]|uniref:helix-turn-helix domain-containing protein n=1 Tax=Streptomyces sp. NA04227 TaxID=2742136 RepID=UPI0020CA4F55|nr:helix-turn-helix transcriptional regulator [Streptomyces sp. NA04227]
MENHPQAPGETPSARFGALVTDLATKAGYDLSPRAGGKAALARDIGSMSASAVSRMIDGKTLPMPHQLEGIAQALHVDVRTLLVTAGVISDKSWPKDENSQVRSVTQQSQPISPEDAANAWGITDLGIRSMLIGSIQQAIRLQAEVDGRRDTGREAARG